MTTTSQDLGGPKIENRRLLRARLLANPNYFGTIADSALEPVFELSGDTTWEELVCLGYNPTLGQLEAVVSFKPPTADPAGLVPSRSTGYDPVRRALRPAR